jgi:hypothetical protein
VGDGILKLSYPHLYNNFTNKNSVVDVLSNGRDSLNFHEN